MPTIDCTLFSDGSSDAALLPVIRWVIAQYACGYAMEAEWADLRRSHRRRPSLADCIFEAVSLYPCDILIVHRDAEAQPYNLREHQIADAMASVRNRGLHVPHVCLIPVRMQEAWLLLEEAAIRRAAGNPNGTTRLALPAVGRIESIPDPKQLLYDLLRSASGLGSRRLRSFRPGRAARLVSENMGDMTLLRRLPSFQRFEAEVRGALSALQHGQPQG